MNTEQTTTTPKKTSKGGRKHMFGFLVEKLERGPIVNAMTTLGLEVDKDASVEALAVTLVGRFGELAEKGAKLIPCDNCQGLSPDDYVGECPFCGEADSEEPAKTEGEIMKTKEDATTAPADPKAGKGKKKTEANGAASTALATTNGKAKNGHAVSHEAKPLTEADLDAGVAKVQSIDGMLDKAGFAIEALNWEKGHALKAIYDDKLYLLRMKGKKPAYTKWGDFTEAELDLTGKHAMDLMLTSAAFPKPLLEKHGVAKMRQVLRAPEDAREKLLADVVEKGASLKEVADAVKKVTKGKNFGSTGKGAGRKGGKGGGEERTEEQAAKQRDNAKKGSDAAAKKRADAKGVTAAILGERVTIKLFKKPERMGKGVNIDELPIAKAIGDEPVGYEEFENEMVRYYFLTRLPSGQLALRAEMKRIGA